MAWAGEAVLNHRKFIFDEFSFSEQTGFLWNWNYMITKRWKDQATGDEAFMRRIMADFKSFCENDNNRLVDFWEKHPDEQANA